MSDQKFPNEPGRGRCTEACRYYGTGYVHLGCQPRTVTPVEPVANTFEQSWTEYFGSPPERWQPPDGWQPAGEVEYTLSPSSIDVDPGRLPQR